MHELITVALVLTCLCALTILAACTWAIVEFEVKISVRVLPMDEVNPWYFGLVREGMDSDQLAALVNELDQVRSIALEDLSRIGGTSGPMVAMYDTRYETRD